MPGIDAQTVLCVHCDGSDGSSVFTDASQYAHSLTRSGVKVDTDQSMFGGGSALYQGTTGQYIQADDSSDWNFGSGDFTIDLWAYFNSVGAESTFICQWSQSAGNGSWLLRRVVSGGSKLQLDYRTSGGNNKTASANWTPSTGTWYHIAVVRSGTTLKFYVNGTNISGGGFDMTGITFNNSPSSLSIGDFSDGGVSSHDGWLDEIRISKGVARWTTNFTPPTEAYDNLAGSSGGGSFSPSGGLVLGGSAAVTSNVVGQGGLDANCVLLLHCDGADGTTLFPDASASNHAMSRAQIKVDTGQSKFGGASAQFQGATGQWITTPDSPDWYFAAGDFTIDFWMRFNATTDQVLIGQWDVSAGNGGWYLMYTAGGTLQFTYRDSNNVAQAVTRGIGGAAVGTWYHYAVVRSGGAIKIFVNGQQVGTDYAIGAASLYNSPNALNIGSFTGTGNSPANGWMDEIRISKVARWTSNFTPPTGPYTPSFNTTYNDACVGGIALGGSDTNVQLSDLAAAGGIRLGGPSPTLVFARASTPSGGIVLGGKTVIGPAKLTVRLLSGGVEIGSWTHVLTGNQARVSWARFQLPMSAAPVVKVTPGKAKLRLGAKPATLVFRYTLTLRAAKLLLKPKPFDVVDPAHLRVNKSRLRMKGKAYAIYLTQRTVVGKPKLILNARPVARAGQPGLIPTVPIDIGILVPTTPDQGILVPTAAKSTLLKPTAVRGI